MVLKYFVNYTELPKCVLVKRCRNLVHSGQSVTFAEPFNKSRTWCCLLVACLLSLHNWTSKVESSCLLPLPTPCAPCQMTLSCPLQGPSATHPHIFLPKEGSWRFYEMHCLWGGEVSRQLFVSRTFLPCSSWRSSPHFSSPQEAGRELGWGHVMVCHCSVLTPP